MILTQGLGKFPTQISSLEDLRSLTRVSVSGGGEESTMIFALSSPAGNPRTPWVTERELLASEGLGRVHENEKGLE